MARRISVLLLIFLLFFSGCMHREKTDGLGEQSGEQVELFYFSPCESCNEGEKFKEAVMRALKMAKISENIECRTYNVFQEKDSLYLKKRLEDLEAGAETAEVPVAIFNEALYCGGYQEIGEQLVETLNSTGIKNFTETLDSTDTVLMLFTTFSCDSCEQVKQFLSSNLPDKVQMQQGTAGSQIRLLEYDILEEGNMERLRNCMEYYGVPSKEQQVPILFFRNGYLSGEEAIQENIMEKIYKGEISGTDWLEKLQDFRQEEGQGGKEEFATGAYQLLQLFGIGLLNGLNPCAASMLFMVVSVLFLRGRGILKESLTYMTGKAIAYLVMGMGVFQLFSSVSNGFRRAQDVLTLIFAVLALILSLLNLWDYHNLRRKEYGKIIVQLPKKLRNWNQQLIGQLKKIPSRFLIPTVFLLGIVISAGEFFCTGQLYAATIYSMLEEADYASIYVWRQLMVYVAAMCIPQLILIFVINRTGNLLSTSRFALKRMPVVKLSYAVIFFLLFLAFS